jgi:hypothetical protein
MTARLRCSGKVLVWFATKKENIPCIASLEGWGSCCVAKLLAWLAVGGKWRLACSVS